MAVLSLGQIVGLIKAGQPEFITEAKEKQRLLNVHINGRGAVEYLKRIEGHENPGQFDLRKKFVIRNKYVFSNLLRPVDKVFQAKGGSRIVDVGNSERNKKTMDDLLSDVRHGLSIRAWIKKVQANKYYSDPAGFVFFEWKGGETFPTMKSIQSVQNYKTDGRLFEWILFAPEKRKQGDKELEGMFYRFVDDEKDIVIKQSGDSFTIANKFDEQLGVELEEIDEEANPWGRVPAIVNGSDLNDSMLYADSPVDSVIDLADKYMRNNTVKNIYEFLHGYPFFWMYAKKCSSCKGTGVDKKGDTCKDCGGHGMSMKKDVSDAYLLATPRDKDSPTLSPNVAGYVEPSVATWQEMRSELDWMWRAMHFTVWGTSFTEDKETATGEFLNVQPVNDRLNDFSDAFEDLESKMIDFIGEFYLGEVYKGNSVSYGRRYIMESPDKVWEKFMKAKLEGASPASLNNLYIQYLQSEFMNDSKTLAKMLKAMKLEPFVHKTIEEVRGIIDNLSFTKKLYFNEWWLRITEQEKLIGDLESMSKDLELYVQPYLSVNKETETVITQ